MRVYHATVLMFVSCVAARPQRQPDPEQVLALARDKVVARTNRLRNYTCVQTVDRKYLKRAKPVFPGHSCDQLIGERNRRTYDLKLMATDRLRLDVKDSDGIEIGNCAGSSHFEEGALVKFVKGPFGTGPFGAFLADIFSSGGVQFGFVGETQLDGVPSFQYRFQVPREVSHYLVEGGDDWHATGYDGMVWVDPGSFDLRRLQVRTSELPEETGGCEADTIVDYANVRIRGREFLLPRYSDLKFLMRDTTENEVPTVYTGCREYVGEAELVVSPRAAKEAAAQSAALSVPAGLTVSLELVDPIDTNSAAAGDVVVFRVTKAARDPRSGMVLIPEGSPVRGRIIRMHHWLAGVPYFVITLLVETVEVNGRVSPFHAVLKHPKNEIAAPATSTDLLHTRQPIYLVQPGQSGLGADFVFMSGAQHYVIRRGYKAEWATVTAP